MGSVPQQTTHKGLRKGAALVWSRVALLVVAVGLLAGCIAVGKAPSDGEEIYPTPDAGPVVPPSDAGAHEGGVDASIDASVDAAADTGVDAAADAAVDATADGSAEDAAVDAGEAEVPSVDGVLGDSEWAFANWSTSDVLTDWGPGENELTALGLYSDGVDLYIGIKGRVNAGNPAGTNVLVVYLDGAAGGVSDMTTLTDNTGPLDRAMSSVLVASVPFAADVAFGTALMSHYASADDPYQGFRVLDPADDFAWLSTTSHPSHCGADGCEARIALSALGSPDKVWAFARIVNAGGDDLSNQAVPEDATPETPSAFLALDLAP